MIFALFSSGTPPIFGLLTLCLILLSISVHEFSHALSAYLLGDPTAKYEGRLTLNPLAHFDVFGLLAILLTRFGWGKPVPINPQNFRSPVRDSAIVSFAGPLSNFVYAGILLLGMKVSSLFLTGLTSIYILESLIIAFVTSVALGLFNLMPIYPLDGEKILRYLLPYHLRGAFESFMSRWGMGLLILAILPILPGGQSVFGLIFTPVIGLLQLLLLALGLG